MSHYLGALFKMLAATAVFVFSVSLSYSFFVAIEPPAMPWFVWAAMGLTEFGLVCWLAVFMLQKHHDAHKTLAFVMVFVCLIAVMFTDAMELARLFGTVFFLANLYYYGLIVLLLAHFLAFVLDFFIGYFSKYSFSGNGNLIPMHQQNGNLIPMQGGYYLRPLASANQPKDATMSQLQSVSLGQVAQVPQLTMKVARPEAEVEAEANQELDPSLGNMANSVKEAVKLGASTVMKKASHYKKRGRTAAPVPGKTNGITEESTLQNSGEESSVAAESESVMEEPGN